MIKVVFEGNTLETIRQLPDGARYRTGYEIDCVQRDKEPENWKAFSAIEQGAREIRIQLEGQYRIIYIAKYERKVHVLHVFRKKHRKPASQTLKLRSTG